MSKKAKVPEITQEMMKNARTSGSYEDIWISRGKCVFCDLKDKYILYEENGVVLTISLYPYIDGHMMAIPRRHVQSNKELTNTEWATMRKMSYMAKKIMKKVHGHKGMWTLIKDGAAAQATVGGHLHMHFIPFDKSDLCEWNYRDLEFTPLQNVSKYKEAAKDLRKANDKFEKKYKQNTGLQLVADLLLVNDKNEVLLIERDEHAKFVDDNWSMPGGHIDDIDKGILPELEREMQEELNYKFDLSKARLLESQLGEVTFRNPSKHLKVNMPYQHKFLWNVYMLTGFKDMKKLKAGDDAKQLFWIDLNEAVEHNKLSSESKKIIKKAIKLIKNI